MDELRSLRVRFAAIDEDLDRADERPDDGSPRMVGQVFNNGAIPTSNGKYFAVHPVTVGGTEAEGQGGVLTVDTSQTAYFLVLGKQAPTVGDYLVGKQVSGRWVAWGRKQVATCNATLSGTLYGCAVTSITPGNPGALPAMGISWTAVQNGVTVASGVTDSGGNFTPFVVQSTATVTINLLGLPARIARPSYTVTPLCGQTVSIGGTLGGCRVGPYTVAHAGDYTCINIQPGGYPGPPANISDSYCLYPISTILYLTSPNTGNLITLGYFATGNQNCQATNSTIWQGSGNMDISVCGGSPGDFISASEGFTYNPISDNGPQTGKLISTINCVRNDGVTQVQISQVVTYMANTCPTATSGFSATGGGATLTE